MRRIMIRTIFGVSLMTLLAAGIAVMNNGKGLVLRAQTESETKAAQGNGVFRRPNCTNGTIHGRFGTTTHGYLVLPTGAIPFAANGIWTFDYSGTLTNAATTSTNGVIATGVTTGTYSVSDDCSGQISVPSVSGPPLTFNIVVADRGNEISFIATRAPAVLSGVARRID